MRIENTELTPRAAVVKLLGLSDRQFQRLITAGVFKSVTKGLYDLTASIKAWVEYHANGQTDSTNAEERRLLTIAQRKRIELDIAERGKELIEISEVRQFYLMNIQMLTSQLEGLPGRMAYELAACSDPAMVRAILLKETRRVRQNLADQLNAVARSPASRRPAETTTNPDSQPVG